MLRRFATTVPRRDPGEGRNVRYSVVTAHRFAPASAMRHDACIFAAPVVEGGALAGILTESDFVRWLSDTGAA
jgi:CBS domain-containing protein